MAKYNIYKIDDLDGLQEKLRQKEYKSVAEYKSSNVSFNFCISQEYSDVWWSTQYKPILPEEYHDLKATTYSAILIALIEESVYAVSMGRSFSIIDDYCDQEFGINVAQRIGDGSKSKMKSSIFNGGVKSRSITSNVDYSNLDFTVGESINLLKMKAENDKDFGRSAIVFGSSIQLANIDISARELGFLIEKVNETLALDVKFKVPRSKIVINPEKIKKLNDNLVKAIENGGDDYNIGFYDFDNFGVNIFFTDDVIWQFKYKGIIYEDEYSSISIDTIKRFCDTNNFLLRGILKDLKLVVRSDQGRTFTKELIYFIDYQDDDTRCYLENGRWKEFNNDYLEDLQFWVKKIEIATRDINFNEEDFLNWCSREKESGNPAYKELYYNKVLSERGEYQLYDRKIDFKLKRNIEICDVYDPLNKKIIVTKRGDARNLGYALDQASSVISLISNGRYIPSDGGYIEVDEVELWLIFTNRSNPIQSLMDIRSFTFLSKINALYAMCREKDLKFSVSFSYERRSA